MFKKDIDEVRRLHEKYDLKGPLLDAGGAENPIIADYDISMAKAVIATLPDGRTVKMPHREQGDRYLQITRPWSFIDPDYLILNPGNGDPCIEQLPWKYVEAFNTVIVVSVFEHVDNPYDVSDALFKIIKPGGYLFNSTVFMYPHHKSPEDNWRYTPECLVRIHHRSGFSCLESGFHIKINANDGVGVPNQGETVFPLPIHGVYAFCQKAAQ